MDLQQCYKKIDNFLNKEQEFSARIVNFVNSSELNEFIEHYSVNAYNTISFSTFCHKNNMPQIDELFDKLSKLDKKTFIFDITTYLNFYNTELVREYLLEILSRTYNYQVVVVGYQLDKFLFSIEDPRKKKKIINVEGEKKRLPKIILTNQKIKIEQTVPLIDNLSRLPKFIEHNSSITEIYLVTHYKKNDFNKSIYNISEIKDIFDIIKKITNLPFEKKWGEEKQWIFLFEKLKNYNDFRYLIEQEIFDVNHLDKIFQSYNDFNANKKWLYFIALKIFGANNNCCLSSVIQKTENIDNFIRNIYRSFSEDVSLNDKDFWNKYVEWKNLRKVVQNNSEDIDYCQYIQFKEENALFYITDLSIQEKEFLFEFFDRYKENYINDKKYNLKEVLSYIYSDLAFYLETYKFDDSYFDFTNYFMEYKYQKMFNTIFPTFEDLVKKLAKERLYNRCLPLRVSKTEAIDKMDSHLYFFDALGVEYLGYIAKKCEEKNLFFNVQICRANLPTITSENKEFIEEFNTSNVQITNIKELDEIKHKDQGCFDYQKTKLPIHLVKELDCIDKLIELISNKLQNQEYKKAIIISDHGASRLAVIKEDSINIDVNSKGTHSGRVCEYKEEIIKIETATRENDYYILADYSRFKGGRQASVEVHGGATLEELMVPIIEITKKDEKIEVFLQTKEITIKRKEIPFIKIFIKAKLKNINIRINEKVYNAEQTENNGIYKVELPDLTKKGMYNFSVYSENNIIANDFVFEAKKEGMQQNDLF